MQLIELYVKNYRSLKHITIPFHDLTVFIGENDSGKSSILALLGVVLNGERPDMADYCGYGEVDNDGASSIATEIEAVLKFKIPLDIPEGLQVYATVDGLVHVRKVYTPETDRTFCLQNRYTNEFLNVEISEKNTQAEIDELLRQLGINILADVKQKSQKLDLIRAARTNAESELGWQELSNSKTRDLRQYLPSFERYQTLDYEDPARMVPFVPR